METELLLTQDRPSKAIMWIYGWIHATKLANGEVKQERCGGRMPTQEEYESLKAMKRMTEEASLPDSGASLRSQEDFLRKFSPVGIAGNIEEYVERKEKWDRRFLELAKHVSSWSKDPSTKVGAVIVDANRRVVATGYNGFPRGVEDTPERY